ncbi:MAG: hypothetical protein ACK5IP_11275 [Paracoccus sp. (in: a-proteobacteria)]
MRAWGWPRLREGGPLVSSSGRALRRFPEPAVDRRLRARALIEQRRADSWSVCAHCDCGLGVRPIRTVDGELRACCPHDSTEDVILEADDLRRFRIDPDRFAALIAVSGNLAVAVAGIADGVWLLGDAPSGHAAVLCIASEDLATSGAILAIKAAAGRKPILLIASAFAAGTAVRLRESGIEPRQIADVFQTAPDGRDRLVLDSSPLQTTAPRLVLNLSAQSAMLDGRRLDLPTQMFALFRLLIEQSVKRDPVLKNQEIETQTGRPPNQIIRDLRKALVGCGLTSDQAKALVATVHARGYLLGLAPAEVVIEPCGRHTQSAHNKHPAITPAAAG